LAVVDLADYAAVLQPALAHHLPAVGREAMRERHEFRVAFAVLKAKGVALPTRTDMDSRLRGAFPVDLKLIGLAEWLGIAEDTGGAVLEGRLLMTDLKDDASGACNGCLRLAFIEFPGTAEIGPGLGSREEEPASENRHKDCTHDPQLL